MGGDRINSGPPQAECSGIRKLRTPPLVVPDNAGPWIPGHPPPREPPPRPRGSRSATTSGALLDLAEPGIAQLQLAQRQAPSELTAMETV